MADASKPESAGDSGAPPGGETRRQNWAFPFALFVAGFAILIAAARRPMAVLPGYTLKGLGAALCIAGFLLTRRGLPRKPGAG